MLAMIEIAHLLFTICLFIAIACAGLRLWRGPTLADRLNAADVIALCAIGLALGHGWLSRDTLWLDVAMVAGLVLYVGTTGVSLFLSPAHLSRNDRD
jgi:multisubunit Na+/H+ antiporter MnhF subunit